MKIRKAYCDMKEYIQQSELIAVKRYCKQMLDSKSLLPEFTEIVTSIFSQAERFGRITVRQRCAVENIFRHWLSQKAEAIGVYADEDTELMNMGLKY